MLRSEDPEYVCMYTIIRDTTHDEQQEQDHSLYFTPLVILSIHVLSNPLLQHQRPFGLMLPHSGTLKRLPAKINVASVGSPVSDVIPRLT